MPRKDVIIVLSFDDKGTATVKRVTAQVKKELDKTGKSAQKMGKEFNAMRKQVEEANKKLNAMRKRVEDAGKSQTKFKKLLKSTAMQMAAGMGVMVGVSGAVMGIKRAVVDFIKTGREFEREWANVTTMLNISEQQTNKLKTSLIGLSPTLGGTTELAKGMYQVLSASIDPAKAIMFLGESAKSAAAGVTEAFVAVDALTTVINAYGMVAEDVTAVSDIMFQTVKRGKLTYAGMAQTIGTVIPIAAQVGVEFEEIAAAMATLTRQGVNVNTTTVQLRGILVSVLKPTSEAQAMSKKLGLEFNSTALKAKGLVEFLKDIKRATKGDAEAMTALFGNVRALTGVFALAGQMMSEFEDDLDRMKDAAGSTEEAFRKQMQSLDFWIRTTKNLADKMKISFYEGLVTPMRDAISSQDDLDESMKSMVGTSRRFGEAISVIGGVIKTVLLPVLEREAETLKGSEMFWAQAIQQISYGLIPAYSNLITEKKENIRWMIEEAKRSKDLAQAQVPVYGPMIQFAVRLKSLVAQWVRQGLTVDEMHEKLKEYRGTQEKFAADLEILRMAEELDIKTKNQLQLEYDILTNRLTEMLASGKFVPETLRNQAVAAAKLAKILDTKLDPSLMKLTEKETLLTTFIPKVNRMISKQATVLDYAEHGFRKASTAIYGIFAPSVFEAMRAMNEFGKAAEGLGFTLKSVLEARFRKLTSEYEKYKDVLDPVEHARYVDEIIAVMVRLGIVGVATWKAIREEIEKALEKLDLGVDKPKKGWEKFLEDVREFTGLVTTQMDAMFNQLYQNQMIRIDNEYQKRKEAIDADLKAQKDAVAASTMSEKERFEAIAKLDEASYFAHETLDREMNKKRLDALRKQAAAQKVTSLAMAIINVAEAITGALKAPFPLNLILPAVIGAMGAVQIAAIAAQPLPSFATGGIAGLHGEEIIRVGEKGPELITPLRDEYRYREEARRADERDQKVFRFYLTTYVGGKKFEDVVVKTVNTRGDDIVIRNTSVI